MNDFNILETGWHMSDHLPLDLTVTLPAVINADKLLIRAMELTESFSPVSQLEACRFQFNYESASRMLHEKYTEILNCCDEGSPDLIIETLERNIIPILKTNKSSDERANAPSLPDNINSECDALFEIYSEKVKNPLCSEQDIDMAYKVYQDARNRLNGTIFNFHENIYRNIIENGDEKKLWARINWSGRSTPTKQDIPIQLMSNYFEQLYQPLDTNEKLR